MCVPRDRRQAGQLLHAQADGGARRELPRAEAHERLGDAAMRKEQPERAKEEEYANVRLLLHATPAHSHRMMGFVCVIEISI